MDYIDYYKVLGVERSATPEQITKAYRRLARQHHPDVSKKPGAEARFKEITEAHEVLKDPEKRSRYDRFGHDWERAGGGAWPPGWDVHVDVGGPQGGFGGTGGFGGSGFSSFFEQLFGSGTGRPGAAPFGDLFGRGSGDWAEGLAGGGCAGADRQAELRLGLAEAFRGGRQTLSRRRADGRPQTLSVTIPAGARDGQRLRLAGQGDAGGGRRGDLYLVVRHEPHPRVRLQGDDLHATVDVDPATAVLGGRVRLRTLDKDVVIQIPPGSSSGRSIRLRGQGWPLGGGRGHGDLYAEVRIVVPRHPGAEERSLYECLAALRRDEPVTTN